MLNEWRLKFGFNSRIKLSMAASLFDSPRRFPSLYRQTPLSCLWIVGKPDQTRGTVKYPSIVPFRLVGHWSPSGAVEGEIHKYHLFYLPINVLITLLLVWQWQCRALTRRRCATESQTYYYIIQFIPCKRRRTITASFVDNRAAPLITLNCGHKSRCITQLSSPEQGTQSARTQSSTGCVTRGTLLQMLFANWKIVCNSIERFGPIKQVLSSRSCEEMGLADLVTGQWRTWRDYRSKLHSQQIKRSGGRMATTI